LIEETEPLALAGIDDALPLVEADAPPPAEPQEMMALLVLARRVASVRRRLGRADNDRLRYFAGELPETGDLVDAVAPRLGRDGRIDDNASPELARLRREMARVRAEVLAELERVRRTHRDAVTDAPPTLRRERYCLPVRSSARSHIQGLVLDVSSRGATSFVEPFSVVELNNRLAAAMAGERAEIQRILREIAELFVARRDELAAAADLLAELDSYQARALFGKAVEGTIVRPGEGPELVIRGARHPLLDERLSKLRQQVFGEQELRSPDQRAVPLDFAFPDNARTLVISGPNAGGKTVVLKTLGLMVLMCARGIPLPVEIGSSVPAFGGLWCHIGDEQDMTADLSTFSGAMTATSRLLQVADEHTLVLYDELGAGTDPLEGAAIGCALLEDLTLRGSVTVVTTHLAAIALAASAADSMENAAMDYDEASQGPTYTLSVGRPGRSRALEIAGRVGVPEKVLERARELLGGDHLELDRWLRRLEALEQELEAERRELRMHRAETDRMLQQAKREAERLAEERRSIPTQLASERDVLRRRAKEKLDKAIARLHAAIEEHEALGRRKLQKLREEAMSLELPAGAAPGSQDAGLKAGDLVRTALGGTGTLREVRGSQAQVEVSGKKLWVALAELECVGRAPAPKPAPVRVETADSTARELNLIGQTSERAREELERFLDQALNAGAAAVRVVHGHGTGTLRRMVADVCRSHPAVRSYRHPPQHLGGAGATEIEIRTD
jgi:DNA mismatch repair protein MutS2